MTFRKINHGWQGKQVSGFSQSRRDKNSKTPNIIYRDLFSYYDFGLGQSYSGSGTTLNDLSGNANTLSLVNTPTYSPVYEGVETFNSTNTAASGTIASASTSALTFIAFIKRNGTLPEYANYVIARQTTRGVNDAGLGTRREFQTIAYVWGSSVNNYFFDSGLTPPLGQWCMVAAAIDLTGGTIYLNTRSVNNTQTNSAITWGQDFVIGCDTPDIPNRGINSDIGLVMTYKRKLSRSEIMQTFQEFRPRFGI